MFALLLGSAHALELVCNDGADDDRDLAADCADLDCAAATNAPGGRVGTLSDEYGLAAGDLDGDGDDDLVASAFYSGTLAWWENQGSTWLRRSVQGGLVTGTVRATDLDADGDLDLLLGQTGTYYGRGSSLLAWENQGNGTFVSRGSLFYAAGTDLTDLDVGDVDGDGDLDLLVSTWRGVGWLPALGGWSFGAPVQVQARGAEETELADLDADGDLDVATTDYGIDAVGWYPNTGRGAFGAERLLASGSWRTELASGDLDGDGDTDLASATWDNGVNPTGFVSFLENLGGGAFAAEVVVDVPGDPLDLQVSDVDGDGGADLLVKSWSSTDLRTVRSLGGGLFAPAAPLPGAACDEPFWGAFGPELALGDLDGRGAADVACLVSGAIEWHSLAPCGEADSDLGGATNGAELGAGTDPALASDDRPLRLEVLPGGVAGGRVSVRVTDGTPGRTVALVASTAAGWTSAAPACPGGFVGLQAPTVVTSGAVARTGEAVLRARVPAGAAGLEVLHQAVELGTCRLSPVVPATY